MTRLLALSLLLSLGVAEAQDPVLVRGGALKRRAYQTYAPVTLYVDPTGSDSNPCTSSGTAACLTTTGALMKLPRNIMRENSTVGVTTFFAGHVEASGSDGCVLFQNNFGGSYFSQLTTYCLSAGGYGILAHPPRTQAFGAIALLGYGSLGVKNCDWGISISSPMTLEMGTTTIDTATTGLEVLNGGTINLRTGTPTFTSVTNELAVDGTNYTLSYFNTLSPARIMGPFNSRIINQ